MEFTFAVARGGDEEWVLRLDPMGPGRPVMELTFPSRPDCEQAILMIREAPVRYIRTTPPSVQGSARSEPPVSPPS
ncbi:hypothetical protein [Streptacidiphilus sp. PAMC 29251]|jgi:hypothetical protein